MPTTLTQIILDGVTYDLGGSSTSSDYVLKAGDTMTGSLVIKGTAASGPLMTRGINGSDGNGAAGDLYINYAGGTTYFGTTGGGNISADGKQYSGNAATASKIGTATVGGTLSPIYLNAGTPTTVSMSATGDRWGCIPFIGTDGVMEIGKYLDFHTTDADTNDNSVRIAAGDGSLTTAAKIAITNSDNSSSKTTGALTVTGGLGVGKTIYTNSFVATGTGLFEDTLTVKKSTTIAANSPVTLQFNTVQTDNSGSYNASIKVYDDHDAANNGSVMVISSGGLMVVGGGEAPASIYSSAIATQTANANLTTVGASSPLWGETQEQLILCSDNNIYFVTNCNTIANRNLSYLTTAGYLYTVRSYNAVWNDFAEFRQYDKENKPYGYAVREKGDDTTTLTTERLQPGSMLCSDTYGASVGDESGIPIAVAGRVLAYTFEPREEYRNHIGAPVCSGPDGTVSLMSKEEQKEYPECVIGYVSAVPDYKVWGTGEVEVDGRVWIKVK